MGYAIHIKREKPITLEEWKLVASSTQDVRLDSGGASITNPQTGEVISIEGIEGDAQINVEGTWYPCFRWRPTGSVLFKAPAEFHDPESRIRRLACELAVKLDARVLGDEGEEYQ
jgi:hypothetical protein